MGGQQPLTTDTKQQRLMCGQARTCTYLTDLVAAAAGALRRANPAREALCRACTPGRQRPPVASRGSESRQW